MAPMVTGFSESPVGIGLVTTFLYFISEGVISVFEPKKWLISLVRFVQLKKRDEDFNFFVLGE